MAVLLIVLLVLVGVALDDVELLLLVVVTVVDCDSSSSSAELDKHSKQHMSDGSSSRVFCDVVGSATPERICASGVLYVASCCSGPMT